MTRINGAADAVSYDAIQKFTNPTEGLDSEWLEALEIWAADPDMILILEGPTLNYALANLGKSSPAMSAAQMVLRHLRELTNFHAGRRGDMMTPVNMKMKTELVNMGKSSSGPANSRHGIRKLWVWHTE
jgi:hypothetical protein